MKHQKHAKLTKPNQGFFARNEISFLGSNCNRIQQIAQCIANSLNNQFNIGYVDADHASHDDEGEVDNPIFKRELTDKISYHQFDTHPKSSVTQRHTFFGDCDLVFVNGNHERANNQIVIIDPKKEASLIKRKDSLTNVIALIGIDSEEIPAYIKEVLPNYNELPLFLEEDQQALSSFTKEFLATKIPKINGLILGGGKSTRMGVDKLTMDYHGTSQLNYLNELLRPVCEQVFVSLAHDQEIENTISDTFMGLGPYGGILSAFQKDPNSAWFSVPCDVPLLDKKTVNTLVSKRDTSKVATCFYNSETDFPEPLITIWEPKAYPILLHYLSQGYSCPRKVLINTDVAIVKLEDESVLMNANTAEDRDLAASLLSKTTS
ncbi:NTP transferase domain-containing protein [Spongiivirga citrea]|uniref:Probable molybdenum cofactor guanylyltransferase n=1 Tax=Spongiivirga citrea TaxID=1481457 RepID=A0A6M0CTB1_9FLAO|nr:NTP transferase domain-containing protein [Spongiivirga citrea]NER18757.1 NTP transferase domain-containing protein [Spongiivirga citrea]